MKKSLALAFFCLLACLPGRAATKVYLKQPINSDTSTSHAYGYANTTASVLAFTTSVTNTTASGTSIEWTKTAGGTQLKWISPPLAAPVTISGTVTMNVWAFEDSALANATVAFTVKKFSGGVESTSLLTDSAFGSEIGTSVAVKNWTASPTSVTFAAGDRIVLIGDIVNVGTMAGSHTVTVDYGGKTGAADGDSWVQFNETLSFSTEPEFIQLVACIDGPFIPSLPCTFAGVNATGNTFIVFSGWQIADPVASFTDSASNTYTAIPGGGPLDWTSEGAAVNFEAFHADNITGGSAITTTMHFAPDALVGDFVICEYAGLSASPVGTAVLSSGTSATAMTASITPEHSPVMLTGIFASSAGISSWPPAQVGRGTFDSTYDFVTTSTGAQAMNFSLNASADWIAIIVPLTPAATTPVTPVGASFYGKFTEPGGGDTKFPIVTVCSEGADYTHQPCNLPVTIYTDSTMAMTKSNPFRGDSHGNFDFSAPQGVYVVSAGTPFVPGYSFKVNLNSGGGSGVGSLTGCTILHGFIYQNGTDNIGTCETGVTHPAAGSVAITAGADATSPLVINQHSGTQSAALVDVNKGSSTSPQGVLTVRGQGLTGSDCDGEGAPCLLQLITTDNTTAHIIFRNDSGNSGTAGAISEGPSLTPGVEVMNVGMDSSVNTAYSQYQSSGSYILRLGPEVAPLDILSATTTETTLSTDLAIIETAAPSGAGGKDKLWADLTAHRLFQNPNNAGAENIASFSSTAGWVAGDCIKAGTNPGQLAKDTSSCGGGAGGMNTSGSNAAATAVSASWIPGTINSYALGSNALSWTNVFLGTVANQTGSFDTSALTANRSIKIADAASTTLQNCAAAANQFVTSVPQTTGLCAKAQPTLANIAAGASPAGLFNFAASTVRIPEAAGFTASGTSTLGLDTTANAVHTLINSADAIVAGFASAPAGSKCAQSSGTKGLLAEASVACGTWTDSSTKTGTNFTASQEGSGNVITVVSSPWFRAAGVNATTPGPAFDLPVTNAPAPNPLTGTNVMKATLDYDDSVNEFAQFDMALPHTWTGAIDINLKWLVTTGGGSNAVKWTVQTSCSADAATYDTAFNAAQTITTNVAANNIQTVSSQATVTVTGCAVDNVMNFKVGRDTTDTFTGTARLIGAQVIYRHTGK